MHWLTLLVFSYVIAAQTLCHIPGWSILAFGFAALLMASLCAGRVLGLIEFRIGAWLWIPASFLGYCLIRSLYATEVDFSPLFPAMISSFLGGIALALALQSGVSFKVLACGQATAAACNIIAGSFLGIGTDEPGGMIRNTGLAGNANEFALDFVLGACLIWFQPKKSGVAASAFAFVMVGYAIAQTGSRSSLLVLPFFLVLVFAQTVVAIRRNRTFYAIILALGLCITGAVAAPMIWNQAKSIPTVQRALTHDASYATRLAMAREAFRLWKDEPVFGHGYNSFSKIGGFGVYAHNGFLEILCDLGLLGAFLFYSIHVYILLQCWKLPGVLVISCWLIVLALITLEASFVIFYMKVPIMLLMVLMGTVSNAADIAQRRKILRLAQSMQGATWSA